MSEDLKKIFLEEVTSLKNIADAVNLRVKYLGKKGILTARIKSLSSLPPEEKRLAGRQINELKQFMENECDLKEAILKNEELKMRLLAEAIDITLPGKPASFGHEHPLSKTMREVIDIFSRMGFDVEEGPEIELDCYNFEALNIPKDHPARDMQDTFYISEDIVLRTHTSPVQVRVMEKKKPPLRFIAPGKVYRCDADVTHSPMFHQVEGLMVDHDVTFSHLKGVMIEFLRQLFRTDLPVRFRPSFFPFTEPSAEIDIGCIFCKGIGCRVCKGTGWLEIGGAGMVHPKVFENVGYDTEQYTGFAFGMGIERIAMLRYGIDDIRLLFENDIRFLRQF
ncbi:MAG TPA: phenylalanine--tRNA ligase subunit alpha [Dissulfurispiraceae bacterium]|nr:phenylalanine--tRNA ligase subunit alpha [Dissulfurispiraceae bacterium]